MPSHSVIGQSKVPQGGKGGGRGSSLFTHSQVTRQPLVSYCFISLSFAAHEAGQTIGTHSSGGASGAGVESGFGDGFGGSQRHSV